jgi:hypothetical protein
MVSGSSINLVCSSGRLEPQIPSATPAVQKTSLQGRTVAPIGASSSNPLAPLMLDAAGLAAAWIVYSDSLRQRLNLSSARFSSAPSWEEVWGTAPPDSFAAQFPSTQQRARAGSSWVGDGLKASPDSFAPPPAKRPPVVRALVYTPSQCTREGTWAPPLKYGNQVLIRTPGFPDRNGTVLTLDYHTAVETSNGEKRMPDMDAHPDTISQVIVSLNIPDGRHTGAPSPSVPRDQVFKRIA